MRPVDKPPDVTHQFIIEDIDLAIAGTVQPQQVIEQRSARPAPVAWAFITAAIARIRGDKAVQTLHDFEQRVRPALRVVFHQQHGRQPVGVDPWVPVVHPPGGKPHPPEVIALQQRGEDAVFELAHHPGPNQRRDRVERVIQQVEHPRQQCGSFPGEQVDDRLGGIRQAYARLLVGNVRRDAPARLFADAPQCVDNRVQEAPLTFDALRDRHPPQDVAAFEVRLFVVAAVTHPRVLQVQVSGQVRPLCCQGIFTKLQVRLSHALGQCLPGFVLAPLGKWMPRAISGYGLI